MAGELTPDDGYALLQNTTPGMATLRDSLMARRKLAERNMAAQAVPQLPVGPRMRALMMAGQSNGPPARTADPYADTPEDAGARKTANHQIGDS